MEIYLFIILVNSGKAACDLLQLEKIVWRGLAAPTPGAAVPGMLSEKLKKEKKTAFLSQNECPAALLEELLSSHSG